MMPWQTNQIIQEYLSIWTPDNIQLVQSLEQTLVLSPIGTKLQSNFAYHKMYF